MLCRQSLPLIRQFSVHAFKKYTTFYVADCTTGVFQDADERPVPAAVPCHSDVQTAVPVHGRRQPVVCPGERDIILVD